MALIDGITRGVSLAVLGDDTIVHVDRASVRGSEIVHSAPDGALLHRVRSRVGIADVAAHPTDAGAAVVAVPARGVDVFAGGALSPLASAPGAAAVAPGGVAGGAVAAIVRARRTAWWAIDPGTGATLDSGTAIAATTDVVAHPTQPILLTLAGTGGARRLVALRPGAAPQTIVSLPGATRIAAAPSGEPRIAIGYSDGRVELRDPDAPASVTPLASLPDPVWGLAARGVDLVAGFGAQIDVVPVVAAPGVDLEIEPELYLASWTRVGVAPQGGVSFDDLAFVVDPPHGGIVSASRDASFDPAAPHVVLAAGGEVGDFAVVALDRASGAVLSSAPFRVTDAWKHPDGPPVALVGASSGATPDAAWGGGDPYVPQNLDVRPRLGDYRVAVLIIETADSTALSAADAAALEQTYREEIFSGVARGGVTESTRLYFDAVSSSRVNLVERGIVSVRLPQDWDDYTDPNTTTGRTLGDGLSNFSAAAVAEIVRRNRERTDLGQPVVLDLDTVDSLVCVIRSLPAATGFVGRHQWPFGTRPGGYQQSYIVGSDFVDVFLGLRIEVPRSRTIQALTMPTTWATEGGGRSIAETVAHELGHNFGLHDAYFDAAKHDPSFANREMGTWDLMGTERDSPEMSAPERMQLGWVPASDVVTLSVGVAGYVDEEVRLHPAGRPAPTPGSARQAIELRIADGHNYYFEYRRRNSAALSDQMVPEDLVVVGTDYVSGDTPPTNRRPLTLIRDDADADRGTFRVNDDYEESDTTDPSYPNDFSMTVLETAGEFARVRLRYADAKPDPSIRPWAQSTNWKSPDLRIQNQHPSLADVPWEGHDNWIVATVRNTGRDVAKDVEVSFGYKDFTLGGGAEHGLGALVIPSIAAGASISVTSPIVWRPPALSFLPFFDVRQHYCVFARITAHPDEITRDNNEAQSNHTLVISASSSPSTRETGAVRVTNPHPVAARCRVVADQTDPLSRTYLEHAWVDLPPGGERDVAFWTESMIGDPTLAAHVKRGQVQSWEVPNSLRLTGVAETGEGCHGDVTGGAHVTVLAGRRTRFVDLKVGRGYAYGRVEVEETGESTWGDVVVSIRDDRDGRDLGVFTTTLRDGNFRFEFEGHDGSGRIAQAEYGGGYSLAPCRSEWVEIDG